MVTRHSKHGLKTGALLVQKGAESAAGLALESGDETSANGVLVESARKKERSYFLDVKASFLLPLLISREEWKWQEMENN